MEREGGRDGGREGGREREGEGGRENVTSSHCVFLVIVKLTLLTRRSVWSKWRPYSLGASPPVGSIFTHTSSPL